MHTRASELKAATARVPQTPRTPGLDLQPNHMAPLLRDEKSRRDWIERELDICCQVLAGVLLPLQKQFNCLIYTPGSL